MAKRKKVSTPPIHKRKLMVNFKKQEFAYLETIDHDGERWEGVVVEYWRPTDYILVRGVRGLNDLRIRPHWPTNGASLRRLSEEWGWDEGMWERVFAAVEDRQDKFLGGLKGGLRGLLEISVPQIVAAKNSGSPS